MKLKFFAFFCLIAVFLSGCTGQITQTPEQKAINLVDNSDFGRAMAFFSSFFERGKNCNFDKFIAVYEKQAPIPDADKEKMKTYIESAKRCLLVLNKKAVKTKQGKFEVTYSFKVPETCEDEGMKTMMNQSMQSGPFKNLTATADLGAGKVTEPSLPQDATLMGAKTWNQYREQTETQMKQAMTQTAEYTEQEKETLLDCIMVGSLAMYKYMQEQAPVKISEETGQKSEIAIPTE